MTYTMTYEGYVQLNVMGKAVSQRPYDWTLVAKGETQAACEERVKAWIRAVNRHQKNPTMYHVHIIRAKE
jgi:hypothetical protein